MPTYLQIFEQSLISIERLSAMNREHLFKASTKHMSFSFRFLFSELKKYPYACSTEFKVFYRFLEICLNFNKNIMKNDLFL